MNHAGDHRAVLRVTVEQLTAEGAVYRQFAHAPRTERTAEALIERIEAGYFMTRTRIVVESMCCDGYRHVIGPRIDQTTRAAEVEAERFRSADE